MRVITILLRHGGQKYPNAEDRLNEIFSVQLSEVQRQTVIVDTMLPPDYVDESNASRVILGGDNTYSEWSAADGAIRYLGSRIWCYDLVHIATLAFNTLYTRYLERFSMPLLKSIADRAVCVGHIDCYNEAVGLLSYRSQSWLRTSFIFLPPAELKALQSLAGYRDTERLFTGDPKSPFRADAPLSENYRRYILSWLTGQDIGQGTTWHSGFNLDAATLPNFERKTLAILNEHLFSIRLRALGTAVVDVTWLATMLSQNNAEAVPWRTGWRSQLANRDTDALVLPVNLSQSDGAQLPSAAPAN